MRGLFSVIHSRLAKDQRPVEHQQPNQTTHETTSSHLYNVGRFFPDRDRSVFMPLCLHASDSLQDRCGLGHKARSRVLGRVQLSRVSAWLFGSVVFCTKIGVKLLLRVSLVLAVCGLAMCSWDLGFAWLACGRLVTGFAGASLVIQSRWITDSRTITQPSNSCRVAITATTTSTNTTRSSYTTTAVLI